MMIYGSLGKSKPKKKTKKEIADYESWIKSVASMKTTFSSMKSKSKFENKFPDLSIPAGRDSKVYPSIVTFGGTATKPVYGKVYTGTAMKGIGTLHKSNAVPIFSDEEARDQANMRR
mgnify:CR=1 FL=1|jgi:hypothetical protein